MAIKPLTEYVRKRDLNKTPEPRAKRGKASARPIFVIQQHAATRLHWDFRLEADGVLKSWAVTKEPVMDPSIKRLAVRVEDHPLAYATFHGNIPAGGYGAGHVDIWDNGTYKPKGDILAGLDAGKLEVNLHGKKLKGLFALVRMGQPRKKENWLLIKMKDEFAEKTTPEPEKKTTGNGSRKRAAKVGKPLKNIGKGKTATSSKLVQFTNLDKMMFPAVKVTKGDILHYYAQVADHLLPHLKDRPITLERLPDGLAKPDSPRFWQKNTPTYYPDWIPRVELPGEMGKRVQYTLVNDANTLLYLVNQGAITFHPFLSRIETLDHPDFVLFDLDPGEAPFGDVVKIARKLHELLDEESAAAYLKTSGKSGLHVVTPWTEKGGYTQAREWAAAIAERLVKTMPTKATTERLKMGRNKRVYVDVIQNAMAHHVVPPYVIRAVPEATVATPLEWDELTSRLNPKQFSMDRVLQRLKRQKSDPMGSLVKTWH